MKVLFLDVDGVINCSSTTTLFNHMLGIDPYMTLLVNRICEETGAEIVLSSTWRLDKKSREFLDGKLFPKPIDVTPDIGNQDKRGDEIQAWLDLHPEVTKYAILDDNNWMNDEQQVNFFKTTWQEGLTEEVAAKVTAHLK